MTYFCSVVSLAVLGCLLLEVHAFSKHFTLNVPQVLLPYVPERSGTRTNFTLTAQKGCFKWISTKPDVAMVTPLYEDKTQTCSRQAIITSVSPDPKREKSIILADEQTTGQQLRCDVFVDTIRRIEITTTTRELLLEEAPEMFDVRAFDYESNIFSTLRGIHFDWTLAKDTSAKNQKLEPEDILTFVDFSDSGYESDPEISFLENKGSRGDSILVQGSNTGSALVRVRLVPGAWAGVPVDTVRLIVKENLMLRPYLPAYILPLSFVDYTLERRKQGTVEVVPLPSRQYSLELTNKTVGELVVGRSRVIGLDYGHTELRLLDSNTPIDHNVSADVYVVKPHHLGFHITGENWNLEVGHLYAIAVMVYDIKNHALFMSENLLLRTEISEEYFDILEQSKNGSYFFVSAKKNGHLSITSEFNELVHPETKKVHNLSSVLTGSQPVDIFSPITVEPNPAVILWDADKEDGGMDSPYSAQLKAFGGSGNYDWTVEDSSVITINSEGVVEPLMRGFSPAVATDSRNSLHSGVTKVHVVPPSKISFVMQQSGDFPGARVEAVIGSTLLLPFQISAYLDKNQQFLYPVLDCRKVNLTFKLSNLNIFNVSTDTSAQLSQLPPGACGAILAVANLVGNTIVTVAMESKVFGKLEASVTVAAYPPLKVIDPPDVAMVTIGSSKTFVFKGGPAPWVRDPVHFYDNLKSDPSQEKHFSTNSMQELGNRHVFRVTCLQLGDVNLRVAIGNEVSPTNPNPAREETETRLSCSEPHSLKLKPKYKTQLECPLLQSSSSNVQFPFISGRPLELELVVYNETGRQFDNFTSLSFEWKSSDPFSVPVPTTSDLHHHGNHATMAVQLSEAASGSGSLTVLSRQYRRDVLNREGVQTNNLNFDAVSSKLSLLLQKAPRVSPSDVLMFVQQLNKQSLTIHDGSGFFAVDHTLSVGGSKMAAVDYSSTRRDITVTAFQEGHFQIRVQDLCLELETRLTVDVHMADLYSINVQVPNKVQVGATIVAVVKVMDSSGRVFPASQVKFMNLEPYLKTAHVEVTPASRETLKSFSQSELSHQTVFDVKGVAVGTTNLYFNASGRGGGMVTSPPNEVEVFSPLTISPREIWLVPDAIFQVHSSGGPSQADIVYSINDSRIATVTDSGLVKAKVVGDSMVTGKALAEDGISGRLQAFTEDTVYVHVRRLAGIRIVLPSNKLLTGNEVAVRAHGLLSDNTPFTFGSSVPRMSFTWSVTNMDAINLVSVYDKAAVSLDEERDFAARLHTRNPGVGEIHLEAKCPQGICEPDESVFRDRVQVQVLTKLMLKSPKNGYLLLPQYSSARIETNRDGIARMSYQLLVPTETDPNLVSVSHHGVITTSGINGHAVVMVTSFESESSFNQSVSVHVEVCPVFSLALTPPPSLPQATPTSKYHSFPLGFAAEFTASLHDNKGRKFSRSFVQTQYRVNRNDIIRVLPGNNGSLMVHASQQGEAILKVWLRDHAHIDDYIRVRVGFAVTPNKATVHMGTLVCFSTHLDVEGYQGSWSSGDESILKMAAVGGVGRAVSPGKTVVYHNVPDVIDTRTEIYVERLTAATIDAGFVSRPPPFTNAALSSPYAVPVTFLRSDRTPFSPLKVVPDRACLQALELTDKDSAEDGSLLIQQVPFECDVTMTSSTSRPGKMDAARYVSAAAYFDPRTGSSACRLTPGGDGSAAGDIATEEGLRLTVVAVAFDSGRSYSVESGPVTVDFVPAFSLSSSLLTLSSTLDRAVLTITGISRVLEKLEVSSSDSNTLEVEKTSGATHSVTYTVRIRDRLRSDGSSSPSSLSVRVRSPLTQQTSVVSVQYQLVPVLTDECPADKETLPTAKDSSYFKKPASPDASFQQQYEGYSFLIPVCIGLGVGVIGLVLALTAYSKGNKNRSRSGFGDHIPKTSSPQSMSPIATPRGGSPNTSLASQTGYGGTPMVSMATPSAGSGFKSLSPQSGRQTTPTSLMSRGVSLGSTGRSGTLYSQNK